MERRRKTVAEGMGMMSPRLAKAAKGRIHNVIWHLVRAGDAEGELTATGDGDPAVWLVLAWKRTRLLSRTLASRESAI